MKFHPRPKPTDPIFMTSPYPRGLKKLGLSFSSSSITIHVNPLHPYPSLLLWSLLLYIWWFSILVNYYFQVGINLKVIRIYPAEARVLISLKIFLKIFLYVFGAN